MFGTLAVIQLYLRDEMVILALLKILLNFLRRYRLEFIGKRILKRKNASFKEVECFCKLALQPQEIGEIKQTFVVVEVFS